MAFKLSRTPSALAEINVVPLVDIMLVLLIIFMITAPLLQQGIQINLPKAQAESLSEVPHQVILSITAERRIQLGGKDVTRETLRSRLGAMVEARPELEVFVQADQTLPYGVIAQLMADVKLARVTKLGLVTEPQSLPESAAQP